MAEGDVYGTQDWVVIAPFFSQGENRWLDDFIDDATLSFVKISAPKAAGNWHLGKSKITSPMKWISYFRHAKLAFRSEPNGIIACFPQLAIASAAWKRIRRSKTRLIAYNFNLGELRRGLPQRIARAFASQIDCYVVHSPEEVDRYSDYLGVPSTQLRFVPLQRGEITTPRAERTEAPFVVAMGSAHRDYPTLIKTVDRLKLTTVIVTRGSDFSALPKSPYVTVLSDKTEQECIELMAQARICVTPIANMITASGQVTFVNAMQLGVPVIATRCPGTDGYITHGSDGLLVEPFDENDLTKAVSLVWNNAALRESLALGGRATAKERFSDEVAAQRLHALILAS